MAFSMELELRRTKCGKFDEDIDNCSFQESPELNNVRHTCASCRFQGCGPAEGCSGGRAEDTSYIGTQKTEGAAGPTTATVVLQDRAQPSRRAPGSTCWPAVCTPGHIGGIAPVPGIR